VRVRETPDAAGIVAVAFEGSCDTDTPGFGVGGWGRSLGLYDLRLGIQGFGDGRDHVNGIDD